MSSERKAALIRGMFTLFLITGAVLLAIWFGAPGFGFGREADSDLVEQADPSNIDAIRNQSNCVVVLQAHVEGNEASEDTQKILRELDEERYGEEVRMAEFDVERYPEIAVEEGVTAETAPRLTFYIEGQRVGEFRGPWEKLPVQRKIDEILRGFMERVGKDWRPPVPGMERDSGQEIIEVRGRKTDT